MPSLADQLAKNASLNAHLFTDRSKRKPTVSYLFTGRDADQYDLDTIYALGQNAFLQLCSVEPALQAFEDALFSDRAKGTDRTLLPGDEAKELDRSIEAFLGMLGPYLMDQPTGEDLGVVVYEFNIDAVMTLFLPYHETPHFTKMVSILEIKPNTLWSFLGPYKSTAQNIQRVSLVSEMLRNTDLARFVTALLPNALKESQGRVHRTLLAFNAATLNEFVRRSKKMDEGTGVMLVSALLEPLQLGSYVLLAALSQKTDLAPSVVKSIVGAMAGAAQHVSTDQFVSALVAFCQGQTQLEKVSESTVKALLQLPAINEEITAACRWFGSEKLLVPVVLRVFPKLADAEALAFVENLIVTASVPEEVLLLSMIHQRHPHVVQQVSQEVINENEQEKDKVEEIIMSLSTTQALPTSSETAPNFDLIVSSTHADSNVRAIAVKKLQSVQSALLGRVHDSSIEVLEALYESPINLALAIRSAPLEYIEALASSVAAPGSKPKRATLEPSNQEAVVERLLLPFLMFSKPRQHTAELVWQAVGGIVKASMSMELLKGCAEIVKKEKDGERTVATMVATNLELAAKVADNTLRSDRFEAHLVTLVGTLQAENPHSRAFGFLVMRSLLERMSGAHQVEVANKVLDTLDLEQLPSLDDLAADESLEDAVKPETIGKAVVVKPSSKTTLAWLQVGVIAAIAKVPQPLNKTIDWFKDQDTMSRDAGDLYVSAARKLYGVLNNSGTVPSLALGLLQILFASLKSDVLSFLAGIWTSDVTELQRLQTLALLQATAFLEAHVQEADGIDFQTILPALLVALHGSNAQSRLAALECLKRLQIVSQGKLTQVYKFDLIYGQNSEDLQYLDQGDLQRYLEALLSHSDHFENDGAYLPAFHGQHLTKAPGDKKKDSEYRKRVLCYLLSHVNALSSTNMQITLLQSIGAVTDKAKLQLLLPTVQRLLRPNQSHHENLLLELLRSFNESASKDLNDSSKPFWKVYTDLLHHYLRPDTSEVSRNVLAESLEKGLYAKLDASRQVELCKVFLKLCSEDASLQRFCKQLLTNILNEVPVIVGLLEFYSPSSHVGERASKRAKTSESSEQYSIRELSFLVEILGTKPLPGSIELISHLLQVLNSIVQNLSPTEAEINYTEQLLMSAVETAANGVSDIPNLSPTAIRVDVLVELIRVTENPATFHQALLLMSNLTRLAPESVLHNVMPVFTFMGSNIFHRDDSYSFSVVQKTIDGIVPVMVSSLKKAHANPLDLWASSKDFLHVFTDAVNHIPRHRRTKFFTHLVDVLGTQDFLAPVSMLLVEKVANRVARQTGQDAQSPLELPVSLVNNAPLPIRIPSLVAILEEAQRLISRSVQPEKNVPIFLSPSSEADAHTATSPLKRRAQSFDRSAATAAHPDLIVKGLVALATQDLPETHQDVIKTSLVALDRLLNVLSALDFIRSVSSMMDIDDERIRAGALDLLSKRLPNVSDAARQEASANIVILNKKQTESALTVASLKALAAIASSMESSEQGALADLVPVLLAIIEKGEHQTEAWAVLLPLSKQLGPRIIPHFRTVVQQSVKALKQENTDVVYATLQALLASIPTFWSMPEVLAVLMLYIDGTASASPSMSVLVKALTKRISAKVLLPSVLDLWSKLQVSPNDRELAVFFEIVSRTLRSADRPAILETLRALFKMFVDGLTILKPGQEMEDNLIMAFRELVVKLNETAFRPLFRRLYDWAFAADTVNLDHQIVFIHLYAGLQDYFKNLMNPYMSFLLAPFSEILALYASGSSTNHDLWKATVSSLNRSFINDDGGFWRDDKLRAISTSLIQQVDICVKQQFNEDKPLLKETLVSLVEGVNDDALLKTINLNILMHTRSEEAQVRLFALVCSEALWQSHGNKLLGFVAETATFIAECGEDENDMVVKESFRLKDAVERIAGKIDGL
ncbi:hypothetical protein DFP72DRAFT_995311 [Ephemerocybe angulata]|uniref:U3 small nucleolar RNA-associated protein 10 n=1 Tax=Ephemerocybe angulata TaxID=980116 RepID=A0A8H6H8D4_9AGAR|nr:hypothetical protein DFP72DRAFT_995311 [Tulosesus angulatus]